MFGYNIFPFVSLITRMGKIMSWDANSPDNTDNADNVNSINIGDRHEGTGSGRVILHSDLNNFYASVECLHHPEIREKPVAVCGSQSTRHGIVLAKNYIAKKLGVKTGEAIWEAKLKCPGLVVVHPNYALYLRFSAEARRIYKEYTDNVEAFGIDENWLDVTGSVKLFGSGFTIACEIGERIKKELGITASVGISYNKIFAKLASDLRKPDAVTFISEDNFKDIVYGLPVRDLMYVGHSTGYSLNRMGIFTIGDLAGASLKLLTGKFGKWGETIWMFANGYDITPVMKNDSEPVIKGVGNSLTTPRDLTCNEDVRILFCVLADSVATRLRRHHFKGRTVQIYVRDSCLGFIDRQAKLGDFSNISTEIAAKAYDIFRRNWDWSKNIRSIGVRVTDLATTGGGFLQTTIFNDDARIRLEMLESSIDRIRERFGNYSIQRGLLLIDQRLNANPAEENIIHPVSYFR